jgi:hypothetical protein
MSAIPATQEMEAGELRVQYKASLGKGISKTLSQNRQTQELGTWLMW